MNEPQPFANAVLTGSAFSVADDGTLSFPYGEIPHRQGLQRFTKEAAERMANHFAKPLQRLLRWVDGVGIKVGAGVPVYIGHPDVPGMANDYPDKAAYGWVEDIVAEPDAMRVKVKWSPDGAELVQNAKFRFSSPFWNCEPDGKGGFSPVVLVSIGLTNKHNMPTPAIANCDADGNTDGVEDKAAYAAKKNALKAMLGLPDDANEETYDNAVTELHARSVQMEAELAALKTALAEAQGKVSAANATIEDVGAKVTQAQADNEALANECESLRTALAEARNARVAEALHGLEKEGRLLANEAPAHQERLIALSNEAEITEELAKLATVPPKIKMVAVSADAAGSKGRVLASAGQQARTTALANAVQEEFAALASVPNEATRYDLAWANVRKRHPELFR